MFPNPKENGGHLRVIYPIFLAEFKSSPKQNNPRTLAIITLKLEDQATKNLTHLTTRQLPFITAKSLTNTAQAAQKEVRTHIKEKFHIRKRSGGFENSIRIKPANKRNLAAEIYTMASFASLQQVGGIKKAKDGRLAIPIYNNIKDVKRTTAKNNPAAYLVGDAFKIRTKSGKEMIARRKNGNLKILYFLNKDANIEKRFKMIETIIKTTKQKFPIIFQDNLSKITN